MADFHLLINLQNTEPISAGPFNQIDILYIDIRSSVLLCCSLNCNVQHTSKNYFTRAVI